MTRARRQPRVSRKERGRDAHRACTSQGRGEGSARKGDKEGRGGRWTAKRGGAIWRARRPTSPPRRALGGGARGGEWDRWGGRCAVVGQLQNDQGTDRSRVWRPYEVRKPAGPLPARCGGSGLGRRGAKGAEESRLVSQRNKWGRAESLSRSHLQLAGRRGASKGVGRLSLAGQGGAARRGEAPALEARAGRGASLAGLLARCAQIGRCESPQHGPQQGGTGAGSGEVARPDI